MDHYNYSDSMDAENATNDKSESTSHASGHLQALPPGFHYMTPPHIGSLDETYHTSSHPNYPNNYNFAAEPPQSAEAPLHTEPPSTQVPSHIQDLYTTYVASYDDQDTLNSTRMGHAKSLALALLQHYYPKSEGYFVRPGNLGFVAKHGLNFLLKAKDGKDPVFETLPHLKKGKSKLSPAKQEEREKKRQYKHNSAFFLTVDWHFIEPEDITGFEVLKKTIVLNGSVEEEEYLTYTYLAIIIDDLRTFPFADNNDVHRGDLLADALCRSQYIRVGCGILLFGTRLEFYDFDNGEDSRDSTNPDTDPSIRVEEPSVALAQDVNFENMEVDMRETGLEVVDGMFREVVAKGVDYMNEILEAAYDGAGEEDADGEYEEGEVVMRDVTDGNEETI